MRRICLSISAGVAGESGCRLYIPRMVNPERITVFDLDALEPAPAPVGGCAGDSGAATWAA